MNKYSNIFLAGVFIGLLVIFAKSAEAIECHVCANAEDEFSARTHSCQNVNGALTMKRRCMGENTKCVTLKGEIKRNNDIESDGLVRMCLDTAIKSTLVLPTAFANDAAQCITTHFANAQNAGGIKTSISFNGTICACGENLCNKESRNSAVSIRSFGFLAISAVLLSFYTQV